MRVAFLGFGLIGGSVARALRAAGPAAFGAGGGTALILTGWSPSGDGPAAAVGDGVLDAAAADPRSAVDGAELVILAGPAPACLALLDDLAADPRPALAADAVITDVASTKAALALRATALGLPYVGGHPMAGSDRAGYGASRADLFVDRPWVVVPGRDASAVERVEALARAVGARPIRMSAAAHDQAVAGISHLPLIVAAALVEAVAGSATDPRPDWPEARSVAASGWRDMTRLARGDVAMGSGIVTTNAPAVAARLRDLVAVLETWAAELERPGGPDPDTVAASLSTARAVLEASDR